MTCSEVQRVLPELLDGAPDTAFHKDFETHLQSCPDCSDLLSDLNAIAGEARRLAATEEPAPRVWLRIAAELRAEGLIREPVPESTRVVVPASSRRRWSALWLAPVAAALLAAGAYMISHRPAARVAELQVPPAPVASSVTTSTTASTPAITSAKEIPAVAPATKSAAPPPQVAKKSSPPALTAPPAADADASADDQQFLSVVSTRAPSMRATYESQLQAVNADIRETQAYVDRNPEDADARQHLMDAYEQKALLYQIALDRIQ